MKTLVILLLVLCSLTKCTNSIIISDADNGSDTVTQTISGTASQTVTCNIIEGDQANSIYGVWKLVEKQSGGITGIGDGFVKAENGYTITIKPDGTFSSTEYTINYPNCTTGTATMTTDLLTLKYECSDFTSAAVYNYTFVDRKLELKPRRSPLGGICIDFCGERLCKQALIN